MKKRFTIFALSLCVGIGLYASVEFATTCGYVGHTVNADYFESEEEYQEYIKSLNEIYCGESGEAKVTRSQPFKTYN